MRTSYKVWLLYATNSFTQVLSNKFVAGLLLLGKALRISLFLFFLTFLFRGAADLGGYSREQIIFFYLSFNLVDTLGQLLFREVYRFRSLIINGGLDLILTKPIHPLIRVLLGGPDLLDLIMLVLILSAVLWYGLAHISTSPGHWLLYLLLLINGLIISAAFHIFVLGLGVLTTSVDHLILIFRDLTSMLRIPVDVYIEPIRSLLTFVIPLGIMISFPPQSLMGILTVKLIFISLLFALVSLFTALKFWDLTLKNYQSASS